MRIENNRNQPQALAWIAGSFLAGLAFVCVLAILFTLLGVLP